MTWYYKYIPWFLLERKLTNGTKYLHGETGSDDKIVDIKLLEIEEEKAWIATNRPRFLALEKKRVEKQIEDLKIELEGINIELEELSKDLTVLSHKTDL